MRLLKIFGATVLFAFAAIALMIAAIWVDHRSTVELPTPTGLHAVARTSVVWRDESRLDALAPEPGTKRELLAWLWYPTRADSNEPVAEYLPKHWRAALEKRVSPVMRTLRRDPARVKAHAREGGGMSAALAAYPVVIMRPGLAGLTNSYSSFAEDLASHGFVVVGFDAPYRTMVVAFPDGRVVDRAQQNNAEAFRGAEAEAVLEKLLNAWSADVSLALDRLHDMNETGDFAGRLDLGKVGVMGHSLGGATALQACHDDARCVAGINIDGLPRGSVVREGVQQPFMFLLSDRGDENSVENKTAYDMLRFLYERLPPYGRDQLTILGASHYGFGDNVYSGRLLNSVLRAFGAVDLDPARQNEIARYYVRSFFDVHLKKASPASFDRSRFAEVRFVPR